MLSQYSPPATASKVKQMIQLAGGSNFRFSRPTGRPKTTSALVRVLKTLLSASCKVALVYAVIRFVRERRSML